MPPVDRQRRQLLLHRLLLFQPGLPRVVHRRAEHHVGVAQDALHEGERAVAVQRGADVRGRAGVPVEQHVLPGDEDVVEDDQGIDFVEAVGERVILGRAPRRRNRCGRCVSCPARPCER